MKAQQVVTRIKSPVPLMILVFCAGLLHAQASHADDLSGFSLEDLANVVVTSVSKKAESKNSAAAAIYVLTGEEIRAHGVRSLPEALRLVPGLSVARTDSQNWAVSARGFNSFLADKMEVVLDGRSLYTPLFSGVFWDAQATLIDDIERIEVIRGPGASVWGANAVNGVINIVTKSSLYTQGNVANLGVGTEDSHISMRHGGKVGNSGNYRIYAQGSDYDSTEMPQGMDGQDDWDLAQTGFRTDWALDSDSDLTVQGDAYEGELESQQDMGEISGFNLLGRWNRKLGADSGLSVQTYFEHIERIFPGQFDEDRDQFDLEIVHNFTLGQRQEIVWGASYRRSSDDIKSFPGSTTAFDPAADTLETLGIFVQDQIPLSATTELTLGTKIEENDYTGTEVQPTVRIAWSPDALHTLWGSVSRAVRTPNRLDRAVNIMGFTGSEDFDSEVAVSYEAGYRFPFGENANVDLAAFYVDYDELRAVDVSGPPPLFTANLGEATSRGIEASALWIPSSRSRWLFAYRYLDIDYEFPATSIGGEIGADPSHEAFIRSTYAIKDNLDVTGMLRYVDDLEFDQSTGPVSNVSSYTELNLGLIYRISPNLEWSVHGENLLSDSHQEFSGNHEIERSVFTQLKWRF